jgi:hypothetical protein
MLLDVLENLSDANFYSPQFLIIDPWDCKVLKTLRMKQSGQNPH